MSYCTRQDLERRYPGVTFSAATSPKATDVDDFITTRSAQIDGKLGAVNPQVCVKGLGQSVRDLGGARGLAT